MAITEGQKTCTRCHKTKPIEAFYNNKNSKDGKEERCRDCKRLYRMHKKLQPKEHVEKKRCSQCREVKTREKFNRDSYSGDGLRGRCKECRTNGEQVQRKREPEMPDAKRCSQCGLVKSHSEFGRRRRAKDGLQGQCKECHNLYRRIIYIVQQAQKGAKGIKDIKGIYSWLQVECGVREMAELQSLINEERVKSEKHIKQIKERLAETITPSLLRQSNMQIMIESFVRKTIRTAKKLVKKFRFGAITFHKNKMDVFLEPELARESLEKP